MAGKTILAVAGDRGGWNALELPLVKALDAGCEVVVLFFGTCAEQHRDKKFVLDARITIRSPDDPSDPALTIALGFSRWPRDLLVLGASQSAVGVEAAVVATLKTTSPVLAVQDLYGSSVPTLTALEARGGEGALRKVSSICVTDGFAKSHLLAAGFEELTDRVVVTGGPQFDKTIGVKENWNERRRKIRGDLGRYDLLVLLAGQLNGTAEMLGLVDLAATKFGLLNNLHVCLRVHPRATELDQHVVQLVRSGIGLRLLTHEVPRDVAPASEDVLPGADLVLSGYSTTNFYGILYEMPGVVYVGTPSFRWDLWREKKLEKPPEVEAGAGWYVETVNDLARVLKELQRGDDSPDVRRIKESQRRIAQYNDGHATDRVWAEMQKLL